MFLLGCTYLGRPAPPSPCVNRTDIIEVIEQPIMSDKLTESGSYHWVDIN